VGRARLLEWLVKNHRAGDIFKSDDPEHQDAIDWFHKEMLPPGVESTIYTVNRTLVTVQATYLLPAATAAAAVAGGGGGGRRRRRLRRAGSGAAASSPAAAAGCGGCGGCGGYGGGPGSAGTAVHAKLMADSTQLG
jgi:hypothetical protein